MPATNGKMNPSSQARHNPNSCRKAFAPLRVWLDTKWRGFFAARPRKCCNAPDRFLPLGVPIQ